MAKMPDVQREQKAWFVADEGIVHHEMGLNCGPLHPDMWWFPTIGLSTARVYATKDEAIAEARKQCEMEVERWLRRLEALQPKR